MLLSIVEFTIIYFILYPFLRIEKLSTTIEKKVNFVFDFSEATNGSQNQSINKLYLPSNLQCSTQVLQKYGHMLKFNHFLTQVYDCLFLVTLRPFSQISF